MSTIKIESENYGNVIIKDCLIEVDETNLEEGVSISSEDGSFDTFELVNYSTTDFVTENGFRNIDNDIDDVIRKNT